MESLVAVTVELCYNASSKQTLVELTVTYSSVVEPGTKTRRCSSNISHGLIILVGIHEKYC